MGHSQSRTLRREFVSQIINCGAATGIALSLSGCGTMFHKERINRPHSDELDWKVLALDGLGLILFFIPGIIAFAVDFRTGAIYLPATPMAVKLPQSKEEAIASSDQIDRREPVIATVSANDRVGDSVVLHKIPISTELNLLAIERNVSEHVGRQITLDESSSRLTKLESLDDFDEVQRLHMADQSFGLSPKRFFERWLPRFKSS